MTTSSWLSFREQMPVVRHWAYFDHAAVAPLPGPTAAAIEQWAREAADEGLTAGATWNRRIGHLRQRAAELLNARPQELALVPNTTAGIGLVAEGFPWQPGDNIVTLDNEFPSNLYPWLHLVDRGVQTRRVSTRQGRVDIDRLIEACDERTRIVSVSWVGYASGWRLDVGELAERVHRCGALLMLDAIQGLGVFPLDVQATGVDFMAADGHKWMLGPEGAGIFYLRHEHLNRLRPVGVGWHSVVQAHRFDQVDLVFRDDAARFEGGSLNRAGFLGLATSLDLLTQFGLSATQSALAERILQLANQAIERLLTHGAELNFDRDPAHASGIVTFSLPGHDPQQLRTRCLQAGVALSVRGGGLRISIHAYNDQADLDRLIDCLPPVVGPSALP
jgi:cysteine desulfurase/selenocysteine lyase